MKTWGIRARVLFVAIMPAAFIAFVLAGYLLFLRYADAEQELLERSQSLVKLFVPAAEYGVYSGNLEELQQLLAGLAQAPEIQAATLHDKSGARLAQIGAPELNIDPNHLPDGWTGRNAEGSIQVVHAKIWRPILQVNDPLTWTGNTPTQPQAIGSITLEFSRGGLLARKREMMAVTLLATILTLVLGALFALRLSRDVTEPILSLQDVVRRIRRGNLDSRVHPHPARTMHRLEEGINEMAAAMKAGRDELQQRIAVATKELQKKKDEAEHASIAKSRFLAAASHDLRQPLHALTLFSAELISEADTTPVRQLSGQIGAAVDSLSDLLEGMLDLSRIDLGVTQAELRPIELDTLLKRVVATHAASAKAKGLALRLHRTSCWVTSDPVLLFRMISNLVANAVCYTDRGKILVGVRRVADKIRIEVWDTGIGISAEHQPLIFNEFYQADNQERNARKGLGLGLSLVERLSKLLNHPVHLRSVPGRGSVFAITLARSSVESRPRESTPPALSDFEASVLFVCAENATPSPLSRQLVVWGCDISFLSPASEIRLASLLLFDLVLCNARRFEALSSQLKAAETTKDLPPVIVIGDRDDAPAIPEGLRIAFLAEPFQPAKLRALLQHLLHGEDPTNPDVRSAT